MLNKEKYAMEILNIVCENDTIAIQNGKPVSCENIKCPECDFYSGDCRTNVRNWMNSEHVEPPVDWSKILVDAKILVRNNEKDVWKRRHFAKYENGLVYAWKQGTTSWSIKKPEYVCDWKYAKLAESEG